jgi:hypothetical protein
MVRSSLSESILSLGSSIHHSEHIPALWGAMHRDIELLFVYICWINQKNEKEIYMRISKSAKVRCICKDI